MRPMLRANGMIILFRVYHFVEVGVVGQDSGIRISYRARASYYVRSFAFCIPILTTRVFNARVRAKDNGGPSYTPALFNVILSHFSSNVFKVNCYISNSPSGQSTRK